MSKISKKFISCPNHFDQIFSLKENWPMTTVTGSDFMKYTAITMRVLWKVVEKNPKFSISKQYLDKVPTNSQ